MNGIKQIIDLRLRGFSPSQVWVYVFSGEPMYVPATHPAQSLENGFLAEIHVTPRDTGVLDFRCLTGLTIHLGGTDDRRVIQIMRQIERATPKRLIVSLSDRLIDSDCSHLEQAFA